MDNPPEVSVIIPAYNASRWIDATLESARAQTLRNLEIIVVDDGSTDDTADKVAQQAQADSRIRFLRRDNGGVGAARNTGLEVARGQYIAPLDADDLWAPEKLELQVQRFREGGPRTGMVYCWSRLIDQRGEDIGVQFPYTPEGNILKVMILRNILGNASVPLFLAEALRQTGPYLTRDEQGGAQGCEDWDLTLRVCKHWEARVVEKTLVDYRQHDTAMSGGLQSMEASFRFVQARARHQNPDPPKALFCWGASYFNFCLASKYYYKASFGLCLMSITRSVWIDPMVLSNPSIIRMFFKCLFNLAVGRKVVAPLVRGRSANSLQPPAARSFSLFERIQLRRWQSAFVNEPTP